MEVSNHKSPHALWPQEAAQMVRTLAKISGIDRKADYWPMILPGWLGVAFCVLAAGPYSAYFPGYLTVAVIIAVGPMVLRGCFLTYLAASGQRQEIVDKAVLSEGQPISRSKIWAWLLIQSLMSWGLFSAMSGPGQIVTLAGLPILILYPVMRQARRFRIWRAMTCSWGVFIAYTAIGTDNWTPDIFETLYLFGPDNRVYPWDKFTAFTSPQTILAYLGSVFWILGSNAKPNLRLKKARLSDALAAASISAAIYAALKSSSLTYSIFRFYNIDESLSAVVLTAIIALPFMIYVWRQTRNSEPIIASQELKQLQPRRLAISILITSLLLASGLQRGFYTQCDSNWRHCKVQTIFPVPEESKIEDLGFQ